MLEVMYLTFFIFAVALLYSSVGQAGGSGYLAVMAIFGVSAGVMKPSALVLNVLVAGIATARFHRAGCFSARLFVPFAASAAPFAALGGTLALPGPAYSRFVGYAPYGILSSHPGSMPIHLGVRVTTGVLFMAVGIQVYLRSAWDFAFGVLRRSSWLAGLTGSCETPCTPAWCSSCWAKFSSPSHGGSWATRLRSWRACIMVILYEERALTRKFGASYTQYCRDVPRWMPRARRLAC